MSSAAEKLMCLEEFLDWERKQPKRHEFANGVVTLMTAASAAHVRIAGNIAFALRQRLRGTGCEAFGSDMKVIANGTVRYPDISVTCRPIDDRDDRITEPVVVIEVLSPTTERIDRGQKKIRLLRNPFDPAIRDLEQDERRVDLYTRAETGWTNEVITGDVPLNLTSIGVVLSLDTVYEDTDLDATRRRAGGEPAPAA